MGRRRARQWRAQLCRSWDRKAGYRYDISILQAEFSLTQVLDRPVHGRLFFRPAFSDCAQQHRTKLHRKRHR